MNVEFKARGNTSPLPAEAPAAVASSAVAEPLIQFDGVGLEIGGRTILDDITLTVNKGEFVCVVGPSGCGKTTMLRMIGGLVRPTRGSVRYDGRDVGEPRRDVAIMFQDYTKALLPWRTAAGNVALALEAMRVPHGERDDIVAALLQRVGLKNDGHKFPAQLSGGMQQRVQIARCLAQNPAALLMDEPFGALDAMTRQALQDEIQQIVAGTGATVFFVTHDLEEAIYLGDRVVGMRPHPGRIARDFPVTLARPRDQLTTPEHPEFMRLRHALFEFIREGE
jgi:NitT/TauT family transport system ATP-binding protein